MKIDQCLTPVLIIGFNRPENVRALINRLREVKPSKLFFAVDGPRKTIPTDIALCQETRNVASEIDWECELHTLFREENVGCGRGPSEAISWAFENTSRLIILEDDCFPSISFFHFCDELLAKYENDKRVWIVSGLSIHANSHLFGDYDYLFSRYAHTWGWATWKSRWAEFDFDMKDWPEFHKNNGAYNVLRDKTRAIRLDRRLKFVYDNIEQEKLHSWDTQWSYTRIKNGSRDIVPRYNLIQNVGVGTGTHTSSYNAAIRDNQETPYNISHPKFVINNEAYDAFHYKNYLYKPLYKRVINKIIGFLKHKIQSSRL